jgi:translation initiation factor IF-3
LATSSNTGPRNPRGGNRPQPQQEAHRINDRISAREVRVIADDGEQLGIRLTFDAIRIAEELGLDLVEVAPEAKPPVCRIMDYGKFKYREQKKEAKAKKNRSEVALKEIRIRYRTDSGDLDTKLRQARTFLGEGDKVKFSMRFRGREIAYLNLGVEKLQQIEAALKDIAVIDDQSERVGSTIFVTFAPAKKTV